MKLQIYIVIGQTVGDAQIKANEFLETIAADNVKDIKFENTPYVFYIYITYIEVS